MKNMSDQTEFINDRPLPSRREYHKRKMELVRKEATEASESSPPSEKKKKPLPLTRFLVIIFLFLVVLILTYNFWYPKVTDPIKGKDDIQKVHIESQ